MRRGVALPVVCILLVGLAVIGTSMVRGALIAQRSALAADTAEGALAAAEAALLEAQARLSSGVSFATGTCSNGLCANSAGPDPGRYSWLRDSTHVETAGFDGWRTGHWAEDLGQTTQAEDANCPAERCRYVRVVAAGWRPERTSSLGIEAVMRIDSNVSGGLSVRRLSWRLTRAR